MAGDFIDFGASTGGGDFIDFEAGRSRSRSLTPYEPSILERIAGGTLVGARRDPILRPVIDFIAGAFPGVSSETLGQMEARLEGSHLSDVFEFVGEFGPSLAAGFGVFGLGRAAAVRALAWTGRTAAGARLLPGAARTAAWLGQEVGVGEAIAKPLAARVAEVAGGSAGLGALSGAETYAETGNLDDAGRAALTTAALTAGIEGGIVATFGRLTRARVVDPVKAEESFPRGRGILKAERRRLGKRIDKINERVEKIQSTLTQREELAASRLAEAREQPKLPGFGYMAYEGTPEGLKLERAWLKAKERAEKFYEDTLPVAEKRIAALETRQQAIDKLITSDPGGAIYTRNAPFNPKGVRLMYEQLALKMIHAPESLRGELGPSFARIFKQLDTAETMTTIARSHNQKTVLELMDRTRRALGLSKREAKDQRAFLPVFDAWERGGAGGVRSYMAELGRAQHTGEMMSVFDEIQNAMSRIYEPLVQMGAEPAMTPEVLRGLGVQHYFPHLLADLPEEQIMASLVGKVGEVRAAQMWDAFTREGLGKFSSIDWNRARAGSLLQKIGDGLPYDSQPFTTLFRYLNQTHRRFEYGSRFGFNGELKEAMVRAVRAEGGNGAATLANSVLDVPLGRTYYPQAMRQLSRIALGGQIASKLTLAVIPNLSQPINLLLWGGLRSFGRGFLKAARGEDRDAVLAATALSESLIGGIGRSFGEARIGSSLVEGRTVERLANAADKLGYWTMSRTGFSHVEAWNRLWSGTGSLYMFRDTLAKAIRGRLRGNSLEVARRRFEAMGANLDDIVARARAEGDAFLQSAEMNQIEVIATFKGAQQTQFIPAVTRRPLWWNHPVGRVFTQFKSFALNQGRFIRDQVFAEAARGNIRPLAYFLSFYPVAGEVVGEMRSLARGKPRDQEGLARVVNNYTMVGGIGLFTDTFLAARYGRLAESIFGPTIGDSVQFAERMVQGDVGGIIGMATRQPVFQAVRTLTGLGFLSMQAIDDYLEQFPAYRSEGAQAPATIDFGALRLREAQRKGQP